MRVLLRCTVALGTLGTVMFLSIASPPALAAKLTAADRAWIDTCMAQRQISKEQPKKLRKYCTCMQGIVEDNQPFDASELEHTYPPAHLMCWKDAWKR